MHSAQLCAFGTREPGRRHAGCGRQVFEYVHNSSFFVDANLVSGAWYRRSLLPNCRGQARARFLVCPRALSVAVRDLSVPRIVLKWGRADLDTMFQKHRTTNSLKLCSAYRDPMPRKVRSCAAYRFID
jgi:hypothetical protein